MKLNQDGTKLLGDNKLLTFFWKTCTLINIDKPNYFLLIKLKKFYYFFPFYKRIQHEGSVLFMKALD